MNLSGPPPGVFRPGVVLLPFRPGDFFGVFDGVFRVPSFGRFVPTKLELAPTKDKLPKRLEELLSLFDVDAFNRLPPPVEALRALLELASKAFRCQRAIGPLLMGASIRVILVISFSRANCELILSAGICSIS